MDMDNIETPNHELEDMTAFFEGKVCDLEDEIAELREENARLKNAAPDRMCDVCKAPAGTWCADGCTEAPQPSADPALLFAESLRGVLTMLAASVDDETTKAKNYVQLTVKWDNGIAAKLPFRQAAITFFREGGLSPHERAELACSEALDAKAQLDGVIRRSAVIHNAAIEHRRLLAAVHDDIMTTHPEVAKKITEHLTGGVL